MMSDMKISFGEPFPHDVKVLQITSRVYHILCTLYNNFVGFVKLEHNNKGTICTCSL